MGIGSFVSLLFFAFSSMAAPHVISARRSPGVSWKTLARERRSELTKNVRNSAVDSTVPLPEVDLNQIPQINDFIDVVLAFNLVRDERFLDDPDLNGYKRRSTWMFPDDGCYARATLAIQNLQKNSAVAPLKIFAYGNLVAKTANTFEGKVYWWYHVAPIIGAQGNYYVLDPALEPTRPLELSEWASRLGNNKYIRFSVCQAGTYMPYSSCNNPSPLEIQNVILDQSVFLPLERERILQLGRIPDEELGEHPPWVL